MTVVDINPMPRHPLWTPRQMVANAEAQTHRTGCPHHSTLEGLCLHWSACTYGFYASNIYDAISFFRLMPSAYKSHSRDAPKGALAVWSGGSRGHGHVAPVVDDSPRLIASTDIRRVGKVDVVPIGEIESRWGQRWEGWCKPYFYAAGADHRDPPMVYESKWQHGAVYVAKLRHGVRGSDSVRRMQYRLGHFPGIPKDLKTAVTGQYGDHTRDAVRWWQNHHGFKGGTGVNPGNAQCDSLFGSNYFVMHE